MTVLGQRPTASGDRLDADLSEATPQALFEEARRLRRQRNRRWGMLALIVAVIASVTAVIVVYTGGSRSTTSPSLRHQTNVAPVAAMPQEMVVWKNFRIEVISSKTGRLIRTLATDVALNRGTPQPTVSPGGTVYFDEAHDVNNNPSEQILTVPLSGGPTTVVANGHDPVVSPDGRFLAYLSYADFANGGEGMVVRDLSTGRTKTWGNSSVGPDVGSPSWSPDSKSLSFTTVAPTLDNRSSTLSVWVLSISAPSGSLDQARKIPLLPGMAWAGYVNPTEGIVVSQHWGSTRKSSTFGLSVVDIGTGRIITRLPSVPGQLGVGNVYDGAEGKVQVDLSGQHLALVETGTGFGVLYRWAIGSDLNQVSTDPVPISKGVFGAAWVPGH